jgi:hypothetical protein
MVCIMHQTPPSPWQSLLVAEANHSASQCAGTTMSDENVIAIFSHLVTDFPQWKKAFDLHEPTRRNAGIVSKGVFRSIDIPNHVTIILEASSIDALIAFGKSSDLKTTMTNAGVISVPEVKILRSVQD